MAWERWHKCKGYERTEKACHRTNGCRGEEHDAEPAVGGSYIWVLDILIVIQNI